MNKIFHYVFSTYKRKRAFDDWVAEKLTVIFNEICKEKSFSMICQSILVDHVHLLLEKKATDRNGYVMKMIKGISARYFFKKYPGNRCVYRKMWGRGYYAREVKGEEELRKTIAYIKGQKINGIDKRIRTNWKPRRSVSGFQSQNVIP